MPSKRQSASSTTTGRTRNRDVVLEIEDKQQKQTSRKPLILKVTLLVIITILIVVDVSLNSPFSCSIPSTDGYNITKQKCKFNVVPLAFVLMVEAAQLITMIPNCSIVIIFIARVFQLSGIFGLKVLIQGYQKIANSTQLTPGYSGYFLLCGFIGAMLVVDIPEKEKKAKIIFALVIGLLTAITMALEYALNDYQLYYNTDFWIDMGFTFPIALVLVVLYGLIQEHHKLQSNFKFLCFLIGFVPLMYILVPTSHFNSVGIQIVMVLIGVATYIGVFTLIIFSNKLH